VKFANDKQRRGFFARLNKFSLYYDDDSGRVRSTEFPGVDFKLKTDYKSGVDSISSEEALKVLSSSPEEYFSGVETVEVDLKPMNRGRLGTYTQHLDKERLNKAIEDIDRRYEWLTKEYNVHDPTRLDFLAEHKSNAYDRLARTEEKQVDTPVVKIHHFRGLGSQTPRILAHELGHHIDAETREERSSHKEPIADSIADITYGGKTWRKYPKRWKEASEEQAEYAVALKEEKTPSFGELLKYADEEDLGGMPIEI